MKLGCLVHKNSFVETEVLCTVSALALRFSIRGCIFKSVNFFRDLSNQPGVSVMSFFRLGHIFHFIGKIPLNIPYRFY